VQLAAGAASGVVSTAALGPVIMFADSTETLPAGSIGYAEPGCMDTEVCSDLPSFTHNAPRHTSIIPGGYYCQSAARKQALKELESRSMMKAALTWPK